VDSAKDAYSSPTRNLFKANKESLDRMLIRKLRLKYIDDNPAFCAVTSAPDDTASLLTNSNFKVKKGSERNRSIVSDLEYGSNSGQKRFNDSG